MPNDARDRVDFAWHATCIASANAAICRDPKQGGTMQTTAPQAAVYRPEKAVVAVGTANESTASAISWGAIIGGAFAAAAMGLILVALGTGLGFAAVSPWSGSGASATT